MQRGPCLHAARRLLRRRRARRRVGVAQSHRRELLTRVALIDLTQQIVDLALQIGRRCLGALERLLQLGRPRR